MKILKWILILIVIIALGLIVFITFLPENNNVGIDSYRYYSSPAPCWIEGQLEQIGCSIEEEASPSASPSGTSNTGPEGNVPPPSLVDYNLCTYRDCSVHTVTPGVSNYDGSKVGEK